MKKLLFALIFALFAIAACKKEYSSAALITSTDTLRIAPVAGLAGTVVTLYGKDFGTSATGVSVTFNGIAGSVQSVSNGEIKVLVPETTTGKVSLRIGSMAFNGPVFTYKPTAAVTALAPASAAGGASVTITGTNFGTSPAGVMVTFNGVAAAIQSVSATEIKVTAPDLAANGPVYVTIGDQVVTGPVFTFKTIFEAPYITGNVILNSQAQVDAFVQQNKGRTLDINGSLTISGNDITSVAALSMVSSVSTGVYISNCPALSDMAFVNNLHTTGVVSLKNLTITTFKMDQLTKVSQFITIASCKALGNISFRSLVSIGSNAYAGSLLISDCGQLSDLDFSVLSSADSYIHISGTAITDLSKFSALRTAGSLVLSGNPELSSLHGLENLAALTAGPIYQAFNSVTIEGLNLSGNAKLRSLSGLQNLTNVPVITLTNNPVLEGFCPLKATINSLSRHADYSYQTPVSTTSDVYKTVYVKALTLTNNGLYARTLDALVSLGQCK